MLDSKLKPWLIEVRQYLREAADSNEEKVNISPSLHSKSQLDRDIKGRMIADVYNIAGFQIPDPKLELARVPKAQYLERGLCYLASNLLTVLQITKDFRRILAQ